MRLSPEIPQAQALAQAGEKQGKWAEIIALHQKAEDEGRLICWTEGGTPYLGPRDKNPCPPMEEGDIFDAGPDGRPIRIYRSEAVVWERTPEELATMYPNWVLGGEEITNPEEEEKTWVTIRDAAELSGYDPHSIRSLVAQGKIPSKKKSAIVEYTVQYKARFERDLIHISLKDLLEWKARPKRGRKPGHKLKKHR